jgi:hypothetical protein
MGRVCCCLIYNSCNFSNIALYINIFDVHMQLILTTLNMWCLSSVDIKSIKNELNMNNTSICIIQHLNSSSSIIRIVKSIRMRLAGHVARMGEKRNAYRISWESQKEETTGKTKT